MRNKKSLKKQKDDGVVFSPLALIQLQNG